MQVVSVSLSASGLSIKGRALQRGHRDQRRTILLKMNVRTSLTKTTTVPTPSTKRAHMNKGNAVS